jgi:hypothetical protein
MITDIIGIAGQTTELRKVSGNNGTEYAGPCPKCGGDDRFRVQGRGLWMCRQCHPKWADGIELLRWRDGMSYPQAKATIDGEAPLAPRTRTPKPVEHTVRQTTEPTREWIAAATEYQARCMIALWGTPGDKARSWLNKRGIDNGTIKDYRIGFHHGEEWATWGERRVLLEHGIVIPRFLPGEHFPRFFNIRRPVGLPKYRAIGGGQMISFGLDHLDRNNAFGMMTEGEFDAMLVAQEGRGMVNAFTPGGAESGIDSASLPYLLSVDPIFVAFDNDEAGQRCAQKFVQSSPRMRLAIVPGGMNDVTELHQKGGSVYAFVDMEVRKVSVIHPPKPAPPGLFDDQPTLMPAATMPRAEKVILQQRACKAIEARWGAEWTPEMTVRHVASLDDDELRRFVAEWEQS